MGAAPPTVRGEIAIAVIAERYARHRSVRVQAIAGVVVIRREGRTPDQILARQSIAEAFGQDLTHAVRREVVRHFRPAPLHAEAAAPVRLMS